MMNGRLGVAGAAALRASGYVEVDMAVSFCRARRSDWRISMRHYMAVSRIPVILLEMWSGNLMSRNVCLSPAIHLQDLPVDEAGELGGEEHHCVGDVLCAPESLHCDTFDQRFLAVGTVALPLPFGCGIGPDEAG